MNNKEWTAESYAQLMEGAYMPSSGGHSSGVNGTGGAYDGQGYRDHQVLVMTTGLCFTTPELTQGRTVVILDEGSQIWDLESLLILRAMDRLEKLILFGDSQQLSCYVSPEWRVSANSILDLANLAATRARLFPEAWAATGLIEVKQCMLNVQYRMVKHLGDMISNLFYDGVLRSADTSTVRAVSWHDVRGFSQADEQFSVFNMAEVHEVIRLWRHLCLHGYRADEIVVISMYEAQRQKLAECGVISNARIYNVDSFQGQESPIVILVLSNNMLTDFLKDSRRVNVACSRAQQRLYIVGDLSTFSVPEAGVWQKIAAYAVNDYKPALLVPDIRLDRDFPSLENSRSATAASSSAAAASSSSSTVAVPPPVVSSVVSSWASAGKPSIKAAIKPSPSRPGAGSTPIASPQSHVALAVRNQASAPSTPQQHSQPSPQYTPAGGAPTNLMSRLSHAAMGSSPFTSNALTAPSFTPTKLTSRSAPFVPSKSAMEFVPGGGSFKIASATSAAAAAPVVAPTVAAAPAAVVATPAQSTPAVAVAPPPTIATIVASAANRAAVAAAAADNGSSVATSQRISTPVQSAVAAPVAAAVAAALSTDVPAGAGLSSFALAASATPATVAPPAVAPPAAATLVAPEVSPAAAVTAAPTPVVAAPVVPAIPAAASTVIPMLSPKSVPSIHHPESFPAMLPSTSASSSSSLPPAALQRSSAPLSFAARVAAAAATGGTSSLPIATAAALPSVAATTYAPPTTVIATPFKSSSSFGSSSFRSAAISNAAYATPSKQPLAAVVSTPAASPMKSAPAASATVVSTPVKSAAPSFAASVGSSANKKKKLAATATGWHCSACTVLNLTAQRYCEVCQSVRTDA